MTWPCHRHRQAGIHRKRPQAQVTTSSRLPRKSHAPTLLSAALGDLQCTNSITERPLTGFPPLVNWFCGLTAQQFTSLPNTIHTNSLYRLPPQGLSGCCLLPALAHAKKPNFHLPDTTFHLVLGLAIP